MSWEEKIRAITDTLVATLNPYFQWDMTDDDNVQEPIEAAVRAALREVLPLCEHIDSCEAAHWWPTHAARPNLCTCPYGELVKWLEEK